MTGAGSRPLRFGTQHVSRVGLVLAVLMSCGAALAAGDPHTNIPNWSFEAVATFDFLANVSGGLDTGVEVPGLLDLVAEADWQRRPGAGRHRAKLFLEGTFGGSISRDRVGDLQAVSSIEAPNTVKVFEAWYEYALADERAALLVGLHDLNSEFYVLERASLLVHSSFGNGPEISQANPAIFPTSALAVRLRFEHRQAYVAAGAYDGIPGDPADAYGTHVRFDDGDGVFAIAEAGVVGNDTDFPAKTAIGLWHSSAEFEDIDGTVRDGNSGLYVIAESRLPGFAATTQPGVFFQFGLASASRNPIGQYFGAGLHWGAPFGRTNGDAMSIAVAHARLTDGFRRQAGLDIAAETAVELTYAWQVRPWLTLQPDLQVIIDPGGADVDDAVVLGARLVIALP